MGTIYYIDTIPYIVITIGGRTVHRRAYEITKHTATIRFNKEWLVVKHW